MSFNLVGAALADGFEPDVGLDSSSDENFHSMNY